MTVTGSTFSRNYSQLGGGIYNDGTGLTIAGNTFSGNYIFGSGDGGAIFNIGTMAVAGSLLAVNSAPDNGAGIFNAGTLTVTDSTIRGNSASDGAGGGIYNEGTLAVTNSSISYNFASDGGGIATDGGTSTLTDSTLYGNSTSFNGGGIYAVFGPLSVTDSTFSGNSATQRAAASGSARPARSRSAPRSSPATQPRARPDVSGSVTSQGNNLVGNTGGSSGFGGSDLTGVAADLGPLGDYGGPTETMPLLAGSHAIGKGTTADYPGTSMPITTDERGLPLRLALARHRRLPGAARRPARRQRDRRFRCLVRPAQFDLRGAVDVAELEGGSQSITFSPSAFAVAQTITLSGVPLALLGSGLSVTITAPANGCDDQRRGVYRRVPDPAGRVGDLVRSEDHWRLGLQGWRRVRRRYAHPRQLHRLGQLWHLRRGRRCQAGDGHAQRLHHHGQHGLPLRWRV